MIVETILGSLASCGLKALTGLFEDTTEAVAIKTKDFIKEKTGVDVSKKDELEKLSAKEKVELITAITKREEEIYKFKLEAMNVDLEDKKDARKMQIETLNSKNAGCLARNFIYILALILVCGSFFLLFSTPVILKKSGFSFHETIELFSDLKSFGVAVIFNVIGFFYVSNHKPDKTPGVPTGKGIGESISNLFKRGGK